MSALKLCHTLDSPGEWIFFFYLFLGVYVYVHMCEKRHACAMDMAVEIRG